MSVDHVKSIPITNLDSSPIVAITAGEGGAAPLKTIDGYVTTVASSSVDATYQIVRLPSNAKVKSVYLEAGAQGAGAFDIGVYYATDGEGGQPKALLAAAAISRALFASAVDCASAVTTDVTNESGTYTLDKRVMPLWQAAGLTSDPGGYFDIVMTVTTTAVTTGATKVGLRVTFTD